LSFDLVIFDCDGVLVDSEVIACRVDADTLTRHGYPITADQVLDRFLGRSMREMNLEVEAELGRSLPDDFSTQLLEELYRSFAAELEAVPHIHATLDSIAQPVCVASSGTHERMRISLGRAGLYDRFAPHIFSATQVRNGKPAPDLFLFAAEQMAMSPKQCLVIEDSAPGIAAALAAGMTVLGFHGGSHCRPGYADTLRVAGAAATFDDMRELAGLIADLALGAQPHTPHRPREGG
jgi:HAD superfamily hydrolase (TIGR01509 family)